MIIDMTILSDAPPSLETAQRVIGGWVELVKLPGGDQLLVDEDGLSKQLPYNEVASLLAARHIVGPAMLLCGAARWA